MKTYLFWNLKKDLASMGVLSKAREEKLVKRIGIEVEIETLGRMENVAQFLGITRSEMLHRLVMAALALPLNSEVWKMAGEARPRKKFRVSKLMRQFAERGQVNA